MSVRVRFAPSPTGYLHIGGLRTALYNYLFARRNGGTLVLRIEDTDRARFVADAESDILESLRWSGIDVDEGPELGGPFGPYRQSERSALYRDAAEQLIASGHAYYAFDTPEALDAMRNRLASQGSSSPRYDAMTRMEMTNSLTLDANEVSARLSAGDPHVVRLKVNSGQDITFTDAIRGQVTFRSDEVDDQILLKSDGLPTYHLANVVDDHHMEITHVIRGEEWLSSTPKHILLYRYFGWAPPEMAHLPLIFSPSGGKLSKRKSEIEGIPVFVREYRQIGYEADALVNYLAFLGWNPGDDRELFNKEELISEFSLERVGSSGVQFSIDKLKWYNEQHLRSLPDTELVTRVQRDLVKRGIETDEKYLTRVLSVMTDRISLAADLASQARYFFEDPRGYDEAGVKKRWKGDSAELLSAYAGRLASIEPFDAATAETALRDLADEQKVGAGRIIHPVRLALSGVTFGPGLFELIEVLGRETCLRRIRAAVDTLGH